MRDCSSRPNLSNHGHEMSKEVMGNHTLPNILKNGKATRAQGKADIQEQNNQGNEKTKHELKTRSKQGTRTRGRRRPMGKDRILEGKKGLEENNQGKQSKSKIYDNQDSKPSDLTKNVDMGREQPIGKTQTHDMNKEQDGLKSHMNALIPCTMPSIEFMKLKPDVWVELTKILIQQNLLSIGHFDQLNLGENFVANQRKQDQPKRILKTQEDNTTLPIELNGVESFAVLDSGA